MELRFAEVQSFVSDLAKAREFYAGLLGLEVVEETEEWLIFNVSDVTLILIAGAEPRHYGAEYGKRAGTVVCFVTDDIDRDHAELDAKGVVFLSDIKKVPEGRFVGFQDPDGNLLELVQD